MFEKVDKSDDDLDDVDDNPDDVGDDPDDVDDGGVNPAEEAIVDLLEVEGMERLSEISVFFNFNFRIEKFFFSSIYHF